MKPVPNLFIALLFGCVLSPAFGEPQDEPALILEEDDTTVIDILDNDTASDGILIEEAGVDYSDNATLDNAALSVHLDKARLEAGELTKSGAPANTSNYLHIAFSARWDSGTAWEARLAGRIDGYYQSGRQSPDRTQLDYGESFVRYRGERIRFTLGTQKIIWGRIDELPPTDRMSVVDLSRFNLDDHPDRRRATPAIRLEYFPGAGKLDMVWLPEFRAAELPGRKSIWSTVDRQRGALLGIAPTPAMSALIKGSRFTEDEPHGDAGGGVRYSHSESGFDYALTAQRVRQSTPYYELVRLGRFEARYPRTWVIGGDAGFEALNAAWNFEAAWLSDIPVTRTDIRYTTVEGISWAAGVEFYPGDGDTRVNLQLIGTNLIDAPAVLDRTEIYIFNGAVDIPFAHERWRLNTRFFIGLDKKDLYINPELAYIGWEPYELYLATHYFAGSAGTLGGYYQDNTLLTLGWRADF